MTLLEMRDWFAFALTVYPYLPHLLPILPPGPRQRSRERYRHLKIAGLIEWTASDRESDTRS